MASTAFAFVRLSQSIAGTFSLSHCRTRPVFHPCSSKICRQDPASRIQSLFASSDWSNVGRPSGVIEGSHIRSSRNVSVAKHGLERFQRRVECSASSGGDIGGSSFHSTSAASEASASEAERSLYCESVTRSIDTVPVATPLCERPATHVTCLEDLLQWRRKAEQLAASVGREFYEADGGPDSSDLLRELEWLLDDAVAACCRRGRKVDSDVRRWEACSWRDMKASLPVEAVRSMSPVSIGSDKEHASNESAEVNLEFGAFGTLLKERYTDPVAELAADGACCCDSLRDSLAEMASDEQVVQEVAVESSSFSKESTFKVASFPNLDDVMKRLDNRTTNAHVLLRTSIEELEELWTQRVRDRRPFQYVVGCAHWRDLVLSVQEGVLIPRPETEQMIDVAQAAVAANSSLGDGVWADLGTGSGALAIAVARLLSPSGSVIAVDCSTIAVAVARRNVKQYGLMDQVKVVHGSWFSALESQKGTLAGVLSNPPYIPSANLAGLQAEVGKHEPQSALDGGKDGMNDLRKICQGSSRALRAGGFLALETNGGKQAEAVADLLQSLRTVGDVRSNLPVPCFQDIKVLADFAGIRRFVIATRCE